MGDDGSSKSGAQVAVMQTQIQELRRQLAESTAANETYKMQRDAEMFAVTSVIETLEGRIAQMRSTFRNMARQMQTLQLENNSVC
jgi:regulator of replication initiation timing